MDKGKVGDGRGGRVTLVWILGFVCRMTSWIDSRC